MCKACLYKEGYPPLGAAPKACFASLSRVVHGPSRKWSHNVAANYCSDLYVGQCHGPMVGAVMEFNNDGDRNHHERMMADSVDATYRDIYSSDLSSEAIYNAIRATFERWVTRYELVLTACESGWTLEALRKEIAMPWSPRNDYSIDLWVNPEEE